MPQPHLERLSVVPAVPRSARAHGSLAGTTRLTVEFSLEPRSPAALAAFVDGVSTPGSPSYRHFLARGSFARRFGPSPSALASITTSIAGAGLRVDSISSSHLVVRFSGRASTIGRFLHTTFLAYAGTDGQQGFAAATAPSVSSTIRPLIAGVSGLTSFTQQVSFARRAPTAHASAPSACSAATAATQSQPGSWTTTQLAQAYGLTTPYALGHLGQGITIGVYELAPYIASDLTTYEACYKVSTQISNVNVDNGPPTPSRRDLSEEAEPTLDLEEIASLAPDAKILDYQGPNDSAYPNAPNDILTRIADDDVAQVVTSSWGGCEADDTGVGGEVQFEKPLFAQLAAQGQTFIAASGDNGASDCYDGTTSTEGLAVDDPAVQPDVTGVGATALTSIVPSAATQSVWNSNQGSSGGGESTVFPRPTWQVGPGTGKSTARMVPDVSFNGDPATGFVYYEANEGGWAPIGGTSAAAPLFASIVALADEGCGKKLGLLNPTLYSLAGNDPGAFTDVTRGNNILFSNVGGYSAGPGYDMASGLGSTTAAFFSDVCSTAVAKASDSNPLAGRTTTLGVAAQATAAAAAGSSLVISFPAGTTLPSSAADYAVTAAGSPLAITAASTSSSGGSSTPNRATLTIGGSVPAGTLLSLTVSDALNPRTTTPGSVVISSAAGWIAASATLGTISKASPPWTSSDVTATSKSTAKVLGRPSTASAVNGGIRTTVVAAVTTAHHLEVASSTGGAWKLATPAITGIPSSSASFEAGPSVGRLGGATAVAVVNASGHVIVLESVSSAAQSWKATDVTASTRVAATSGAACLAVVGSGSSAQIAVVSRLASGALELYVDGAGGSGAYRATPVAGVTASSAPSCAADGADIVVAVRTTAGHLEVIEAPVTGSAAQSASDVTASTGSLGISGGPGSVAASSKGIEVGILLTNGHLGLAAAAGTDVTGAWTLTDLTEASGGNAATAPAVVLVGSTVVAIATTSTGHAIELTDNGAAGGWNAYDVTAADALVATTGALSATPVATTVKVAGVGASGHLIVLTDAVLL